MTVPKGFEGLRGFEGEAGEPSESELNSPLVRPGTSALLPAGVIYQAGWEPIGDGMARHARAAARALARAGMTVALRSLPTRKLVIDEEIDPLVKREAAHLARTSIGSAPLAIRQVVIHSDRYLENVVAPAGARAASFESEIKVYQSTIVYTSWERTTVHPEIVEVLNRCARVWVPCRMNRDVFEAAGVKRVDIIPCPFDPDMSPTAWVAAPRGSEDVPRGKRFYAIGKWEPRKNYHALIGAFLSEFTPKEHAALFLKTYEWGSWENYPTVEKSVRHWLGARDVTRNGWTNENYESRLRIVTKKIPEEKMTVLHRDNNIYVSPSHGEAWDLPAFDARVAGNRLVYAGWGGAEDYAGPDDTPVYAPGSERLFEAVDAGYGWESSARWLTVGVNMLRRAMRKAQPPKTRVMPPELYRDFGGPVVASMMLRSLREVIGPTAEELVKQGGFG